MTEVESRAVSESTVEMAEIIYPNSNLFLYNSRDGGYQLAVARAYNDWCTRNG